MSNDSLKISLENIQAIEEASIEVSGFTGIVGRSNIGKSALIRGMMAALSNKAPKSIFREGTKESKIKIDDDQNNIHIEWRRSGVTSLNEYVINGEKHTKVGKEPPAQIPEWGFKPVKINDESLDIQFARQHLYLFLLNQSGGFVADFISKITKADILTGAMKDCESDIRKNSDSIKHADKEIEKLAEELKRFVDIDYYLERSKNFLEEKESLNKKSLEITALNADIEEYDQLSSEKLKLSSLPEEVRISFDLPELEKISGWIGDIAELKDSYIKIKKLDESKIPDVSFDLEILNLIEQYLQLNEKANFTTPELPLVDLDLTSIKELSDYITLLEQISADSVSTEQDISEVIKKINSYDKEKDRLEQQLGKCPLCASSFENSCQTHQKVKEISV